MKIQGHLYCNRFQQKGYFNKDIKLPLPKKITKIALITSTSSSSAAIYDFNFCLDKSNMNLEITVEHVIVQGPNCPKNVADKIDKIKPISLLKDSNGNAETLNAIITAPDVFANTISFSAAIAVVMIS